MGGTDELYQLCHGVEWHISTLRTQDESHVTLRRVAGRTREYITEEMKNGDEHHRDDLHVVSDAPCLYFRRTTYHASQKQLILSVVVPEVVNSLAQRNFSTTRR